MKSHEMRRTQNACDVTLEAKPVVAQKLAPEKYQMDGKYPGLLLRTLI